ncbi:hypothetical protein GEMRC1_008013 [Eukaryota sp. GEM-RC1]
MIQFFCVVLLLLVSDVFTKTTSFSPSGCSGEWGDSACWSNGVPADHDSVLLTSCSPSSVTVSSDIFYLELASLQIGSESCAFDFNLGPAFLDVTDLHYYGGSFTGSAGVTSDNFIVSSALPKVIATPLTAATSTVFSHSSSSPAVVFFKNDGSLSAAGTVTVDSSIIFRYADDHNYQAQSQPHFTSQAEINIENDSDFLIEIPFSNQDEVHINSGLLKISKAAALSANFMITGTLIIDSDAEFGQGAALEGSGTFIITANKKVDVRGLFAFDGDLDLLSSASLDFHSTSRTRYFYPKFSECGATVTWFFDSQLLLHGLSIKDSCNSFIIKAAAVWDPITNFNSFISLSGTSLFHFGSRQRGG